ncbi:MAG: hypothetical protein A2199_03755 [Hydrogenophilales bacterium RIFOXYA1_FULL_63_33]|nr:MAG: hypothetical protein A2199_03755 [Hydrogenophilales bacterium RIFOXYA1_FULL_63_33]
MTMNRNDLCLAGALRDLSRRYFAPQADMAAAPAPVPNAYLGVWRRSLLETADLRDTHSHVFWLQTPRWHADLRLPAGRPDFSGVRSLAECSEVQLAWLARQQGFCGVTQIDGTRCTWHRQMDFQPANGSRDIGRMVFDGERLTETGIETDYLETWERLPPSRGGTAALELVMEAGEPPIRPTWLLVAGACFMYVQGRSYPLSDAPDLPHLIARMQPSHAQLLDWLNVEISFGYRMGPNPWRIEHSTLPFREETFLTRPGAIRRLGYQIAVEGSRERRWRILDWSLGAAL